MAKFFGPSSSTLEGGPRGWRMGWLTSLGGWSAVGTGRPIPKPSYSFLEAASRGERGVPLDEEEGGVLGLEELEELASTSTSLSPSVVSSIATAGTDWEATTLNRKGWGRDLTAGLGDATGGGETRRSAGGGVTLTLGERLLPLRTELLFPPRRQVEAESDLDGVMFTLTLFEARLPNDVPPLITVVALWGVAGRDPDASSYSSVAYRDMGLPNMLLGLPPNLPPRAAVMGT